jgi:hypothetical protein
LYLPNQIAILARGQAASGVTHFGLIQINELTIHFRILWTIIYDEQVGVALFEHMSQL